MAFFCGLPASPTSSPRLLSALEWDFDSRVLLVPAGAGDGYPDAIGMLLRQLVRERRDLHVYVLSWDFVFLFAGNRQFVPLYKLGWRTHPAARISFRLEGYAATAAEWTMR